MILLLIWVKMSEKYVFFGSRFNVIEFSSLTIIKNTVRKNSRIRHTNLYENIIYMGVSLTLINFALMFVG